MKKKLSEKKYLADIIVIAVMLLISGVLLLILQQDRHTGAWAVVCVNGQETARYSLEDDGVYPLNGGTNILVIENRSAYLREANCPDKLCVLQGSIRYTGQCIICLPNKLTVTIEGADGGVDIYT